jgi:uncharacterized protein with HEPN domain
MIERDFTILKHMVKYAYEIELAKSHFGDDRESFNNSVLYRNTVAMSLLQIGELTDRLSGDFKAAFSDDVNWRGLKSFRNICAHNYLGIDVDIVWDGVNEFLPKFIGFCESLIQDTPEQDKENLRTDNEDDIEI